MSDTRTLPPGWATDRLETVADILDSRRVPINADERAKRPGDVPYYGATGQVGWIDDWLFDEEIVLLGEDGAPFLDPAKPKAYMVRGKSWVNNHAHVLRAKSDILNSYLMYQLNQVDFHPFVSGTTRLKLTKGAMNQIPLVIAPLPEQRRIVEAIETQLTRLDAAVAALKRAQANLKRYRASVLKAAVEGRLVPAPESNGGGYPMVRLSGLLSTPLANGRSVPTGTGASVLRLTALRNGRIDLSERKQGRWSVEDAKPFLVKEGDFLVSRGNGSVSLVGRGGLVTKEPDEVAFPDTLIRVRTDPASIDSDYLRLVWDSMLVRSQIERKAKTTAGIHKINQRDLESIEVPLPLLDQQQAIATEIERLDSVAMAQIGVLDASLARADRLRQSILKRAFEGKLLP